jgi:hypothetical protein
MERDFAGLVDDLVAQVNAAGAEIRARREAAPALDPAIAQVVVDAFVAELRAQGWLTTVPPERLPGILEIVVMTEDDGSLALDVDSAVTGSVWGVPGWGVTETDPAAVGRGLAEDELEMLEAMRDAGEITGWE